MGAELGATTSVFPSDEITKAFLEAQGRVDDWTELSADSDAVYDEFIEIDLSSLEPLAAMPHMPDKFLFNGYAESRGYIKGTYRCRKRQSEHRSGFKAGA